MSSQQEMEKAAMSLAAAAVSPIITKLSDKALSYFGGDITEEESHHLKSIILPKIEAVIKAVDNINIMELKPWVMNLRTAAYEAEDVLDMYKYNDLQAQVSPPPANSLEKFHRASKELFAREFFAPVTLKTELKKCLEKLQKAYPEADKVFGPLIASTSVSSTVPSDTADRTSSVSSPSSKVFGRDEECKSIVDILISEGDGSSNINSESSIPILAIRGFGGTGKTTLAKYIFNDSRIAKHFPMKLWVDVSRQLDMKKAYTKMLEDATETIDHPKESLDALQARLKKYLESNAKFLLVLDDVWLNEGQNRLQLDDLLIPFNEVGDIGSRILVTTRAERTAKLMGAKHIIPIKELESEFCWAIIKQYAFRDSQKMISDLELVKIGDQIVNKLKNSPLGATLVGIQLGIQVNVNAWRMILEGDILKDIRSALLWSYKQLPQYLQQCFSFCSIFPKGWLFDESKLVRLWIAQGFVVVPNGSKLTMEDKGREYFNDLLFFSFFQHHPRYSDRYVIHDLLHDLAENISQDHCFRIEGDKPRTMPTTVIHLSINVTNKLVVDISNILERVNLRTFFIISILRVDFINIFLDASKIFSKLKKLRILHLGDNSMLELHSSICELKHIRYLQLCQVRILPESLGRLYHLQFLVLDYDHIEIMPKTLSNLINLKHFDAYYDISKVPEFGKLIFLQRLETYVANGRNQCGIDQLKNLRELRGLLNIQKLQNVESKAKACEAMLKDKTRLERLGLEWDGDAERNDQAVAVEVLEGLQPPRNLKELVICNYIGANSPKWLENNQCLSNLQILHLFDCSNLRVLPSLGQLSSLRSLNIENAEAVEDIGPEFYGRGRDGISFPRLKVLELTKMKKWKRWHGVEGVELHPCLEELVIEDCPELTRMPSFPLTLRKLRMSDCPLLLQLPPFPCGLEEVEMRGLMGVSALVMPHNEEVQLEGEGRGAQYLSLKKISLRQCSSLTHLTLGHQLTALQAIDIDGCKNLRSLILGHQLTALQSLMIKDCEKLETLVLGHQLAALQSFRIDDCEKLGSLVLDHQLTALQSLDIGGCQSLRSLFLDLHWAALQSLRIKHCQNLGSVVLGHHLTALKSMCIDGCESLTSLVGLGLLPSLQCLQILNCARLTLMKQPDDDEYKDDDENDGVVGAASTQLLALLPLQLPSSLRSIQIKNCNEFSLMAPAGCLPGLTSLVELRIQGCPNLQSLPDLSDLRALQILHVEACPELTCIGNLHCLTSLQKLTVLKCPKLARGGGNGGGERLDGRVSSSVIQDFEIEETLLLSVQLQEEALNSLQKLTIKGSREFPQEEEEEEEEEDIMLPHLTSLLPIWFFNCRSLSLPGNLGNLSSLQNLSIYSCPTLKSLPNLETLSSLKSLSISNCHQIESLPTLDSLSSLHRLIISHCNEMRSLPKLDELSSLESLNISSCRKLESLPHLERLSSLKVLKVSHCPKLKSLPGLGELSSLELLDIKDCPEIELLPNLEKHASLKELLMFYCPKIESLQNLNLEKLSSLNRLQIIHFPQLKSLPNLLPSSLEVLYISSCHPELRKKYGKGGPLHHKLRHIPTIVGADLEYKVGSDDMACSCSPLYILGVILNRFRQQ